MITLRPCAWRRQRKKLPCTALASCRLDFAWAARLSAVNGRATVIITAKETTAGKIVLIRIWPEGRRCRPW